MRFGVKGLGLRVGLGFGVRGSGFRVHGSIFRDEGAAYSPTNASASPPVAHRPWASLPVLRYQQPGIK